MSTYIERLVIERNELEEKLKKLTIALVGQKVPDTSVEILTRQKKAMTEYLDILNSRLVDTQENQKELKK